MIQPSGVDAIDLDEPSGLETVPARLTATTIGRLKTRNASDKKKPYLNTLIYGDPGVGKTLLVGTAALVPEMCPILFLDFEEGATTLDHLGDDALENIEILPEGDDPLQWTDVQNIYDYLWRGRHPFKTIIMDTASEAQAADIGHILGYDSKVNIDADLPKFDAWNETTTHMRRMFRGFRDLRMNTIFTAHTYTEPHPRSTKDNPRTVVKPDFIGQKLRQEAPAFFTVVLYMYVMRSGGTNKRYIMADRDETYTARSRIPGVPKEFTNPTMEGLYDVMVRNRNASTLDLSGTTMDRIGAVKGEDAGPKMMRKKA